MNWNSIQTEVALKNIVQESNSKPCVIFKHSTRCPVSSMAKYRLEENWDFTDEEVTPYFLDLIAYRSISNLIAETFGVHHESPQLLLIRNGECTYEESHLDISVADLRENFHSKV